MTGSLGATGASFTAADTVFTNEVSTATRPAPDLTLAEVASRSVTATWTPAPAGGGGAEYTLTRTLSDGGDPTEVYRGASTSYADSSNIPAELSTKTLVQVASGDGHSLAVASDGTVWAWGLNSQGQLGDGTTTNRSAPVQVQALPGGRTATFVAAGALFSLALASDGTAWAWGENRYGQLGDGTTTTRVEPVQVQPLPGARSFASLDAGASHSLAVASDGTAWAWGNNIYKQLGADGYASSRTTPVQVQTLPGGRTVASIAAGYFHSLAVASDGTAWAWGVNNYGQLGDGSTMTRDVPVQVRSLPGGRAVTSVSAGTYNSLAVASDGTAWAWGANVYGQLGDGTTIDRVAPVPVQALPGGRVVDSVDANGYHSVARASDGTAWAWGYNDSGQVGDETTMNRSVPAQVQALPEGGFAGVIVAGFYHSVAVASDGTAWTWGRNQYGQLGDGTTSTRGAPVRVQPIETAQCPIGAAIHENGETCTLSANTDYVYTVTTTVGGWSATSAPLLVTTLVDQ